MMIVMMIMMMMMMMMMMIMMMKIVDLYLVLPLFQLQSSLLGIMQKRKYFHYFLLIADIAITQ